MVRLLGISGPSTVSHMSENRFGVPTNGGMWQPKPLSGSLPEKFIPPKDPMKSWLGSTVIDDPNPVT